MARDPNKVRQEIDAMHRRVQQENYYSLLGVEKEADAAMISGRFRQLAKSWHVDRFSDVEIGEHKAKVQAIFAALNTAHRTLTNQEQRAEYDYSLHDGPDVGTILESESYFIRGKNMLRQGSYKGAHEQFRHAVELNPDDLEFRAHYLYTEYLLIPKNDKGLVINKHRPTQIFEELDAIHAEVAERDWMLTFMATVALGLGKERQAEGLYREAVMVNPKNIDAQRQLRILDMRRTNKDDGGFLSKLFGRFRK